MVLWASKRRVVQHSTPAQRVGLSPARRSTAYRWVTAAREEERRAAKPMRGGPAPRITGEVEAAMVDLAGRPNHPVLAEIAARPAETTGVRVHLTTVHRALRRAGWT